MNVVLVGYRGTGKSVVGRQLAAKLDLHLVSLDAELQKKAGKTVPEIVEQSGWPGFRDLEEEIVRTFAARDGQVIDCGGGVIEREANFEALRSAGPVIWLKASTQTIVNRIADDDQRPSLTGTKSFTDEVAEVLSRRTPLYERISHYAVDTDACTVEEVVVKVLALVANSTAK
jgi:shikimate kinase